MKHLKIFLCLSVVILICACSSSNSTTSNKPQNLKSFKTLALGDSYTIGESVCELCRFPEQLKERLKFKLNETDNISLKIIAKTGWTTTNLINSIDENTLNSDYDLVTLLIGVNNQYQHKPFTMYEDEFPILVNKAIEFAKGDKSNVIIVSIPDYAHTSFGQGTSNPQKISDEIDQYNTFAKNYCLENNITYVNITDITREGINDPELVASDGLHPSKKAYSEFVKRLLPIAFDKLQ